MKLTLTPVCLVGILLIALVSFAIVDLGVINNIFNICLPSDQNWIQSENSVDGVVPFANSFIGCFIKASLAPAPYYDFFAIRPVPPVWEKTLPEYVSFSSNFFCPIMVIVIFLYFYQSSRNGAGLDHHLCDIYSVGFSAASL